MEHEPSLLTPGRIALAVHAPLHRVVHILATRGHIRPAARAGVLRLYPQDAIAMVRHELAAIEGHRGGKAVARVG